MVYLVFIFFVAVFVWADIIDKNGTFRFWNGDEMSNGQQMVFIFVQVLLIIVSGSSAYKRARIDWKLWEKSRSKSKQ